MGLSPVHSGLMSQIGLKLVYSYANGLLAVNLTG